VYNSVLCMTTMDEGKYLVAGLDGGKMELYNINTGITPALSYSIETEAISCLSVSIYYFQQLFVGFLSKIDPVLLALSIGLHYL